MFNLGIVIVCRWAGRDQATPAMSGYGATPLFALVSYLSIPGHIYYVCL